MYQNDFTENTWVKGDVFFNVEMGLYPFIIYPVLYFKCKSGAVYRLGAGMYHQHLISVDDKKLKPGVDQFKYLESSGVQSSWI